MNIKRFQTKKFSLLRLENTTCYCSEFRSKTVNSINSDNITKMMFVLVMASVIKSVSVTYN